MSFLGNQILNNDENTIQCDIYGLINDKQHISKGFLTTESAIQFKLYDNPIVFWTPKLKGMIVCYLHNFFYK